jgi:hypothetical protein
MTITYLFSCIPDDYNEIAGSFASGNDAQDAKQVASIQRKIKNGNVWAWCQVTVFAKCHGFEGESSSLGGCSYKNEAAFKASDNHKDLCQEALEDLQEKVALAAQAEREVYLALNPVAVAAPEFELTVNRDATGCLTLSFGSAHPLYGIQSILLQHDADIESLLKSLSADDRKSVDDGWDTTVAVQSFQ